MARARILRTLFEKIEPKQLQQEARERRAHEKQLANQEKQRQEAEARRMEKEQLRMEAKRTLVQEKIRQAVERGEISEAEAAMLPDMDENALVTWAHIPYIDQMTRLREQMDNGEWAEVCTYLTDKKEYNPVFTETIRRMFNPSYSFEEYAPHADLFFKKTKRRKKAGAEADAEKETEETMPEEPAGNTAEEPEDKHPKKPLIEPWTDNLYDACAPHLIVTQRTPEGEYRFGIMSIWRMRFTKHGFSMMARSQFIKTKLFEQETGIPVFMVIGIGGTAQTPERLFVVPFKDAENHFIPKPVAYRYETDPAAGLHYVPELEKLT